MRLAIRHTKKYPVDLLISGVFLCPKVAPWSNPLLAHGYAEVKRTVPDALMLKTLFQQISQKSGVSGALAPEQDGSKGERSEHTPLLAHPGPPHL